MIASLNQRLTELMTPWLQRYPWLLTAALWVWFGVLSVLTVAMIAMGESALAAIDGFFLGAVTMIQLFGLRFRRAMMTAEVMAHDFYHNGEVARLAAEKMTEAINSGRIEVVQVEAPPGFGGEMPTRH